MAIGPDCADDSKNIIRMNSQADLVVMVNSTVCYKTNCIMLIKTYWLRLRDTLKHQLCVQ